MLYATHGSATGTAQATNSSVTWSGTGSPTTSPTLEPPSYLVKDDSHVVRVCSALVAELRVGDRPPEAALVSLVVLLAVTILTHAPRLRAARPLSSLSLVLVVIHHQGVLAIWRSSSKV
jgi:hypothetical protein